MREGLVMPVQFNHTIVWCRDQKRSSAFLARVMGCAPAVRFYNFMVVQLDNGVSLDFLEKAGAPMGTMSSPRAAAIAG
jgi:catechol 2,3-dioxygenase-like lactoylglutathione lyase family enzyme